MLSTGTEDEVFCVTFVAITNDITKPLGKEVADKSTHLFHLARSGQIDELEAMYKKYGFLILNGLDSNARTLLHAAADSGRKNVCQWILDKDKEILRFTDVFGQTAFHYAAFAGRLEIMEYLAKHDVENNIQFAVDNNGWSSLMIAVAEDKLEVVQHLIRIKASRDDVGIWLSRTFDKNFGGTAVHWAAVKGRTKIVRELLLAGANVYIRSFSGSTALDIANKFGFTQVADILNDWMQSTFKFFNIVRSNEIIDLKNFAHERPNEIRSYVDVENRSGLHIAAELGHFELSKWMQLNGWDVNKKDFFERSALHWAALNARGRIAEVLISGGCEPSDYSATKRNASAVAKQVGLEALAFSIETGTKWEDAREECDRYISWLYVARDPPPKDDTEKIKPKERLSNVVVPPSSGTTMKANNQIPPVFITPASTPVATPHLGGNVANNIPATATIIGMINNPNPITPAVVNTPALVMKHCENNESGAVDPKTAEIRETPVKALDLTKVSVKSWLESIDMGEYVSGLYDEGYDSIIRITKFDDDLLSGLNVKRGHRRKIMAELPVFLKNVAPIIQSYEANLSSLQVGDSLAKWMNVLNMNSIKETLEAEGFDSPGSVVLLTAEDLTDMKIKPAHQRHLLEVIKIVSNRKQTTNEKVPEGPSDIKMSEVGES